MSAATTSIRNASNTVTGAVANGNISRARNAARYALRMLGRSHLLPSLAASLADWRAIAEILHLHCELREAAEAEERALWARNAAL